MLINVRLNKTYKEKNIETYFRNSSFHPEPVEPTKKIETLVSTFHLNKKESKRILKLTFEIPLSRSGPAKPIKKIKTLVRFI